MKEAENLRLCLHYRAQVARLGLLFSRRSSTRAMRLQVSDLAHGVVPNQLLSMLQKQNMRATLMLIPAPNSGFAQRQCVGSVVHEPARLEGPLDSRTRAQASPRLEGSSQARAAKCFKSRVGTIPQHSVIIIENNQQLYIET